MTTNGHTVTDEDIIVCRDVHKWYGNFHALRGVSTTVQKGEVVVIIGPSGSGKSTFIRTINRLEQHQRGDIIVDGIELTNDIRNIDAIRRDVGMVFQSFNLFPHLTVLRNITLAPTKVRKLPSREADSVAMELLERVGIPEQADKYPAQLSGGQQQRVAIARALAMQPRSSRRCRQIAIYPSFLRKQEPRKAYATGTSALFRTLWIGLTHLNLSLRAQRGNLVENERLPQWHWRGNSGAGSGPAGVTRPIGLGKGVCPSGSARGSRAFTGSLSSPVGRP